MKRMFDITVAICGLLLLSPLLTLVAILVRLNLGAPILFCQMRPGLKGHPFRLYKFRTMRDLRNDRNEVLSDNERQSQFGNLLRRLSIDELPELWNVLRGEMSLVGPRPLLVSYLAHYTPEQARRHEVRPGITGWAQIHGRNALSWEDKLAHDVWYVDHQSFWLDLRILGKTIGIVLGQRGVEYSAVCVPAQLADLSSGQLMSQDAKLS